MTALELSVYLFALFSLLCLFRLSRFQERKSQEIATGGRDEAERTERRTERAERRRPSERLAAPPRESRDVTGPPLLFAIPRRAPRRAREKGARRGGSPLPAAARCPSSSSRGATGGA